MAERSTQIIWSDIKSEPEPEPKLPTPETELAPGPEPERGRDLCRMKRSRCYGEVQQLGDYGGYSKDILTENLTEREKDILICTVCKVIMKEASISEIGEQFCSCCCVYGRKTPNLAIMKTINLLKCSCPLIERGCKWLGTLEGCENHLDTCGYVHEKCKLNCGEVLRREELESHEKENCLERQVKCDHCNENFISRELDGHLQKCPKMKLVCKLCDTEIAREELESHLKYDCGMVQETCKLGCGVELTRDELRIHEKENCPERLVKCDHCDKKIKSCELNDHYDVCPKMEVSCDLVGCDTKITREKMELHLKHDCGMVQEMCKLGCGMELTRDELRIHEKENCVQRIIRCEYCFIDLIFRDNSKHLNECPEMKVSCELCGEEKYRKDMTQHLEDDCPEKMLDCPFVKYKCLERIKRKDIDKHLEEKETKHLGLKLEDLINKQSQEINKLNENIEKQKKETTRELSNTTQQIKLLYSITDTTKIIWKIEDVKYSNDFSSMSKQYQVAEYWLAFKFQYQGKAAFEQIFINYGTISIVFQGAKIKPDRSFIAKCRIMFQSCDTAINCGIIEVKQKDVFRGCERSITYIPQEDIKKYSEFQFPGATKKDLTLEIFITMQ